MTNLPKELQMPEPVRHACHGCNHISYVHTYAQMEAYRMAAVKPLVEAFDELLLAFTSPYPSAELGQEAQDAWAERKIAAIDRLSSALAPWKDLK